MSDDRSRGCVEVGALNYAGEPESDADELDLLLDKPDDIAAMFARGVDATCEGIVGAMARSYLLIARIA